MSKYRFTSLVTLWIIALLWSNQVSAAQPAKNVILMIADGGGFNQYDTASLYQYGSHGHQIYNGPGWVEYGCTTYDVYGYYSPDEMWADFDWQNNGPTDSAAAATALNSGIKTYDGAINVDVDSNILTTFAQTADNLGKATGAVTTVPMSHATPACVWAHNVDRNDYAGIANEMIYSSGLDVIMGAGNPNFNDNGQPAAMTSQYVDGSTTWSQLKNGTTGRGWTLIETRADFEFYAINPSAALNRLIGIAQVNTTLQERRSAGYPPNTNIPNLSTMSMAAINVLSKNSNGFYLMIEGGAVDWGNHDNNLGRMIQEQIDFNHAVEAVVNWVETHSSWDETLVVVTADHESGCLWGPGSGGGTFNPIVNNGAGVLPGATYYSGGHTNQLVPIHARGIGSEMFAAYMRGTDDEAATHYGFSGKYVDDTDIFRVMYTAVTGNYECSEPIDSDLSGDCRVDFIDYAMAASLWEQNATPPNPFSYDLINFLDVVQFTADWLACNRMPQGLCWR